MKTKLFTLLFAIAVGTGAVLAEEINGVCYYINYSAGFAGVTYGKNYSGNVTIPDKISYNGKVLSVVAIGENAFKNCTNLTSVTIPNSVEVIYDYAFSGCSGLTNLTIPNSVTRINQYAFSGCTGLINLTIPNSVYSIGYHAFSGLLNVNYSGSASGSPWGAFFANCYAEGCLVYSNANKTNLLYCSKAATGEVIVPNSVTSIESGVFSGCPNITSVTIPNSVTSMITSSAFKDCSNLISVTLPDGITIIGDYAFMGCSSLKSIIIPDNVTRIGASAFYGCSSLKSVTFGKNVTTMGQFVFKGCDNITDVIWNVKNYSDCQESWKTPFYWVESNNTNYDVRESIASFTFGEDVEHIPAYLCYGMKNITSINIPNSVKSVGGNAFSGCSKLTKVQISSIAAWCAISFNSQYSNPLTSAHHLYLNNAEVTNVTVPNGITTIGNYVFSGGSNITKVAIPNSVTSIGNYAFSGCSGLKNVTYPNNLTSIGDYTFQNCSSLSSITIPNSITSIGNKTFYNCSSLTSVVWNAKNCSDFSSAPFTSAVTSFTFGSGVEHIPAYLCYGMSNLTSMTIPSSVTSIGTSAFYNCSGLSSITIPNSITSIATKTFYNCSSLTSVIWNAKNCNDLSSTPFTSAVTSFIVGDKVEHIPAYLCYNMTSLPSITIPHSVTSVGTKAFYGCKYPIYVQCGDLERMEQLLSDYANYVQYESAPIYNLSTKATNGTVSTTKTKFTVCEEPLVTCTAKATTRGYQFAKWADGNTDNPRTIELTKDTIMEALFEVATSGKCGKDNALVWKYDTNTKALTITGEGALDANYTYGTFIESVTIGSGVTSIGSGAFSGCNSLTSVTLNSNAIVSQSYSSSSNIKSVFGGQVLEYILGDEITSIGNYAFCNCSSLTSVTIPSSVTTIGNNAFYGCSSLTSVTIPNSVTSIGDGAFRGCSSLTSPVYNAHVFAFMPTSYSGAYIIPEGIEAIAGGAFSDCSSLTSVTIPNSVTRIGNSAFYNCSSLTSVTIPNNVTSIGNSAFYNCSSLTSVTIPNNVTSIGYAAFYGCSSLTSVTIPNSVTSIGERAFQNCSGLTSVTIPNSVTSIGSETFGGCSSLTSVTIPNSVTSIGNMAFSGCSSLTSVTIGNSVTSIESSIFKGCNNISSVIWNAKNCSTYNFGSQVESFIFGNDVEIIPNSLCQGMNKLTSVTIPNNVTSIGKRAFDGCNNLETVSLGNSLETIAEYAFNGSERIIDIYCYAERVPTVQSSTFDGVSRKAYLWVPANRLRNYETHEIWGEFLVQPMAAEDVNTNTVAVVPDYNTAKIIWMVVENADSYNITITDKDGKTVCTLVFDSNGLLQSIAFGAPSRNNAPEQTQSTGFSFEVSGLEEGTAYDYTIVAKDVASQTLQTFNGSFKTLGGADAIADINLKATSHKILRNGQVLILRDGKTYTVQGQEVR